ncbi:quinolinate synthase A [Litorimonas cladophorae]|uniref:Quinolinate synthase n=1 Tax=Litorimonas cladophorae TaxID=1220491 RepID=A0A918NKN7_9PROT|nr:quinolinate synthase NadA [Litorimonas cladophorae]GGX76114.1 quinolinate synthase A [Litorimonas cladophorae]
MGKELINWENGRWIGQTLEVENGVCAVPGKDLDGMPKGLEYTDEVKAATDHLYEQVSDFIPKFEWPAYAPLVHAINTLKKEKNAVILAHNYMTPDIFGLVGDYVGDSLGLAIEATKTDAEMIIQGGVHFMAETSKILCPIKRVFIPSMRAGCSLASSITGADIRLIKQRYPGVPVVTYVNTSADVKAESDICCTSSNAVAIVEHITKEWGVNQVIMLPDEFLAKNVAKQTDVEVIAWHGRCEVHARFSAEDVRDMRAAHPGVVVLAHPECPPEVVAESDFTGSTKAMSDYVTDHKPQNVILLTECSMSDNVAMANPETDFVRPCNLCPHMKRITLENIYECLLNETNEIFIPEDQRLRAFKAVQDMIEVKFDPAKGHFHPELPIKDVKVI